MKPSTIALKQALQDYKRANQITALLEKAKMNVNHQDNGKTHKGVAPL